jgi:hypothetical protein
LKKRMTQLTIKCVITASTSRLVTGSPTNEFMLGRNLSQGGHLSPFLFLICCRRLECYVESLCGSNTVFVVIR